MNRNTDYWSRYWRKSISRRRVLGTGGALTAGAAGFALVGCGDDDDDDDDSSGGSDPTEASNGGGSDPDPTEEPSEAAGGPVSGGELILGLGAPNQQPLDPHTSISLAISFTPFYTDKMVSPSRQTVEPIEGETVENWEQVDDVTINLNVRQGINYQAGGLADGRAFTAEDVAFNLKRIAGQFDLDRIAQFQRSTTLANMDDAEAVDESTVRVTFSAGNSQFLHGMSDWRNWLVVQEDIEDDPNFTTLAGKSGTGPFKITDWDDAQRTGSYERNPDYWKGAPYLERVRQVSIPDTASSRAAFIAGDTHFRTVNDPVEREEIEKEGNVRIAAWEHSGWEYFRLNQNHGAFVDPNVRQAIHLALDRTAMLNHNYGEGGWALTGPLVSGMPGAWTHDELLSMPGFREEKAEDIATAQALLEAAGFPNGDGIEFAITPLPAPGTDWYDNAITGQDSLLAAFPDMDISIVGDQDFTAFNRALGGGDYDVICYGSFPPPSPLIEAGLHHQTGGGRNYTGFTNAEADALFEQAFQEFDSEARTELLGQLQEVLLENIFNIPLGKRRHHMAYQKQIQNFEGWSGPGSYAEFDSSFSAYQLWLDPNA